MLTSSRKLEWITPDWPVPTQVRALVSTRTGCMNGPPFNGFNTASHVGDDPNTVEACRRYLQQHFKWQSSPQWLNQIHGADVVEAVSDGLVRTADACFARQENIVCTLHTADCLPVFFSHIDGSQVALAHAGWRGLAAGILENTLQTFRDGAAKAICWLGPAISQAYFEVGPEVKARFQQTQPVPEGAFRLSGRCSEAGEHYLCDLYALARARLNQAGVNAVYGGDFCTYQDPRFFSYRESPKTGRILSALWIQSIL